MLFDCTVGQCREGVVACPVGQYRKGVVACPVGQCREGVVPCGHPVDQEMMVMEAVFVWVSWTQGEGLVTCVDLMED